jgi:mono/diheme cytochrome c family protein
MLRGIDKGLALISWVAAGLVALMLLVGPKVLAEDKGMPPPAGRSPYPGTAAPNGKALFVSNCGSCHTLSAAGTSGQIGPKLDGLQLDAATVETAMQSGPGSMPSFSSMPPAQRHALANFVAASQ